MAQELVKIDAYLKDEKLFRMIKKDLSKRHPKTSQTGRNSTPVEVILRMLVVKRLYGASYEETEARVSDSLRLREFCRVYLNDVPDDTTLIRWANLIQPQTLEQFNQRILQVAVERKVTKGRKLRTDGTVVESNIRPPSDGRLLADSVRVLSRHVQRGRTLLAAVQAGFEDLMQSAKQLSHKIGETLRSKKAAAQTQGRQHYQDLLSMTEQTIQWAVHTEKQLRQRSQQKAKRLAETLTHFIPLAKQVIEQTQRRILKNEKVPASVKIVSLFEEHTDIIRRGKESRPVEYGHKFWLNEVEGGLISHYRLLEGNPSEEKQWQPSLKAHIKTFQGPPIQASADRGLSSEHNEQLAQDLGVKHVIIPKRGYRSKSRSKSRSKHEHKAWFVKGRRWHAGVEGRISVLKRAHGLGRCLAHGLTGFQCWVGWGVIAGNLAVLGRT